MAITNADPEARDLDGEQVTNAQRWDIEAETQQVVAQGGELNSGQQSAIRSHLGLVAQLPEPGVAFRAHDLAIDDRKIKRLKHCKAIRYVADVPSPAKTGGEVRAYTTDPHAWEIVEAARESSKGFDCCPVPAGFETLAAGERYACKHCGTVHDYETTKECDF